MIPILSTAISFASGYALCFFTWRRRHQKTIDVLRQEIRDIEASMLPESFMKMAQEFLAVAKKESGL